MSDPKKESPHGQGTYGEKHPKNILGGTQLPEHRSTPLPIVGRVMFDEAPITPVHRLQPDPSPSGIPPGMNEYFKGEELPKDVFVPGGTAYYKRFEDIPTENYRNRQERLKIESIEDRASIVLQVCPPLEGEAEDASFRFVGERGMYVRVIREYREEVHSGKEIKVPVVRWIPFNSDEAVLAGKVRRV